jgi:oxazoline/thiazoline synthase
MIHRPRFKPHLRVEVVPGDGVFLLTERHQTVLQGRLYELVAPCLDGSPTELVCARLHGKVAPAEVFYTLAQLEKRGHLCEADAVRPASELALWGEQQVDPTAVSHQLTKTVVVLQAVGGLDSAPLRELLAALGVAVDNGPDPSVVVTDSYLREELKAINHKALQTRRPWLLVKPVGRWIWLGPLFVPGKTGCWHCLAERLQDNAPLLAYLESKRGRTGEVTSHQASTPATLQTGVSLAASTIASWVIRGELPHLEGKVCTLDALTAESQTHLLIRMPSCPVCSDQKRAERPGEPVVIRSSQKVYTEDGGHRTCSPQETLERYGHHVSAITGAVPMLQRDTVGDGVLHVYLSGHNSARRARSLRGLRSDLRSSNCGKGTTDAQARASALCEGLERYSGTFRGDEPRRRARLSDLGDAGIDPRTCLLFSERQYRERDTWNATQHQFDMVPMPFDPAAEIDWTPVWSLSRQTVRYLPTAYCWFNVPQAHDQEFCYACSNGNAAGNTLEEAILQGFFELVERDSVALWWYNRVRRPALDLESFKIPYLDRLRDFLQQHHRDLAALDVTSDLGIPTIVAMSCRTDGGMEQILFGLGAHMDVRVALLRAVTELNQMLGPVLTAPPDDPSAGGLTDRQTLHWLRTATLENQPYLRPCAAPARRARDFPPCINTDLKDDIEFCRTLAEREGSELLVLDQTRPEIGLPVVKVIVPGLRHFWARFGAGRLYDVPVKLGWLDRPRTEEELNPLSIFL